MCHKYVGSFLVFLYIILYLSLSISTTLMQSQSASWNILIKRRQFSLISQCSINKIALSLILHCECLRFNMLHCCRIIKLFDDNFVWTLCMQFYVDCCVNYYYFYIGLLFSQSNLLNTLKCSPHCIVLIIWAYSNLILV